MGRTKPVIRQLYNKAGQPIGAIVTNKPRCTYPRFAAPQSKTASVQDKRPDIATGSQGQGNVAPSTPTISVSVAASVAKTSSLAAKVKKTDEERLKAELEIDGTERLDLRKASLAAAGPDPPQRPHRLRKPSRKADNDQVGSLRRDSKVEHAVEDVVDVTSSERADLDQRDGILDLSRASERVASLQAAPKATTGGAISQGSPAGSDESVQMLPPTRNGVATATSPATTPLKPAKKKRPSMLEQLDTNGTPFLQESDATVPGRVVKEYSTDGKKWWSTDEETKPDWAVYEREVDVLHKRCV